MFRGGQDKRAFLPKYERPSMYRIFQMTFQQRTIS
uniref:Uncharacterized protein n=1 Tax=Lepeophtheirus salmonis TaxID=72036 RepID=A0A0K2T301_LEPSM